MKHYLERDVLRFGHAGLHINTVAATKRGGWISQIKSWSVKYLQPKASH